MKRQSLSFTMDVTAWKKTTSLNGIRTWVFNIGDYYATTDIVHVIHTLMVQSLGSARRCLSKWHRKLNKKVNYRRQIESAFVSQKYCPWDSAPRVVGVDPVQTFISMQNLDALPGCMYGVPKSWERWHPAP